MKTTQIKIKKISCGGCAARIYRALSLYDGIIKVSVDTKNNNIFTEFDERKISEDKIMEIINTIGFEVIQNV